MTDKLSTTHQAITAALAYDPLATAESITGKDYHDDTETSGLGFVFMLDANQRKTELLRSNADSHMGMEFDSIVMLFTDLGFTPVLTEPFIGEGFGGEPRPETYMLLWHPDGILGHVESYGTRVNSASIRYNLRTPDGRMPPWDVISSGSMTADGVWVGDHDVREGLRHKLRGLRAHGEFLPTWQTSPFMWLRTYAEKNSAGFDLDGDGGVGDDITRVRIARLPEQVRDAIDAPGPYAR